MSYTFAPKDISGTVLYERLKRNFKTERENSAAVVLVGIVDRLCEIAKGEMRRMPELHPEFTLHDEIHLLRVVELMAKVLPVDIIENVLNPVEVSLLILSAYFHDIGMVPSLSMYQEIVGTVEYKEFREGFLLEKYGVIEAINRMNSGEGEGLACKRIVAEFEQIAFARFVRDNHATFSRDYVKSKFAHNGMLSIGNGDMCESLALLCESHNMPCNQLSDDNGFYCDKFIGNFNVNMPYLAIVLRLADLLDFDRERTPDELFKSMNFKSEISLFEWEKHRQVEGWTINDDVIRFECACSRPEYELAIKRFHDYIDFELIECCNLIAKFPAKFTGYKLGVPLKTDRSRIRPKGDAYISTGELGITLAKEQIVDLLMTTKLYGSASLAIRELLQNSMDALRYRKALFLRDDGVDWVQGKIEFIHHVNDDGSEVIECIDNGAGMGVDVMRNYLLKAGSSYYRSHEFNKIRLSLNRVGADFDPCSRFGIGFMSLFMLGDRMVIKTRECRKSKETGEGSPLVAEVNGVGGLVVLKRGDASQPVGTSVSVFVKDEFTFAKNYRPKINLNETIVKYAVGCEFDVFSKVSGSQPRVDSRFVAKGCDPSRFILSGLRVDGALKLEVDFNKINPQLWGAMFYYIPLDLNGKVVLHNGVFGWNLSKVMVNGVVKEGVEYVSPLRGINFHGIISVDGIWVAGARYLKKDFPVTVNSGIRSVNCYYGLDVRGNLKPELSPDRFPPQSHVSYRPDLDYPELPEETPGWDRINEFLELAHCEMWEGFVLKCNNYEGRNVLLYMVAGHNCAIGGGILGKPPLGFVNNSSVWLNMYLPDEIIKACCLSDRIINCSPVPLVVKVGAGLLLDLNPNKTVGVDLLFEQGVLALQKIMMKVGCIDHLSDQLVLRFDEPDSDQICFNGSFDETLFWFFHARQVLRFGRNMSGVLFVAFPDGYHVLNRKHKVYADACAYILKNNIKRFSGNLPADLALIYRLTSLGDSDIANVMNWCSGAYSLVVPENVHVLSGWFNENIESIKARFSDGIFIYSTKFGVVDVVGLLVKVKFNEIL